MKFSRISRVGYNCELNTRENSVSQQRSGNTSRTLGNHENAKFIHFNIAKLRSSENNMFYSNYQDFWHAGC